VRVGAGVHRSASNVNDWSNGTTGPLNWINGAQGADITTPSAMITSDQSAKVNSFLASVSNTFAASGISRGVVGQVGDVITFGKVLSTDQRRAVEEYLSNKWGVSITPGAPLTISAASGTNSATVSWTPPSVTGGAPITRYTVTSSSGNRSCATTGTQTCTVTGLTTGTKYTFTVTATNSVGVGPPSAASNSVKP
jgi:hypothetical protein